MFNFNGKIALITGAGSGMGRADAISLAGQGATVIVTGPEKKQCDAVVAEITAAGGKAASKVLDVTDLQSIDRVFTETAKEFGTVDILVNNAGIFQPKMALELTEKEWNNTLDVNLKGQFFCAQRAAKDMMKKKWGRIVNIASIASGGVGIGIAGAAHYTASKGGIVGMTETLADEWAPYGITVNVVAPGAIDTPMISSANLSKEALDGILSKIPLHRMGTPAEIAAAVVFLASQEASYVTGATLYVDGGWMAA